MTECEVLLTITRKRMTIRLVMWKISLLMSCFFYKSWECTTAVTSDISWTGIIPLEDFNILLIVSLKGEFKHLTPIIEKQYK